MPSNNIDASSPVSAAPSRPEEEVSALKDEIALCLSGGGYRAMLFHLGALWRLNEAGYLGRVSRISSVSGGSITAGALALHWKALGVSKGAPAPNFAIVVNAVRSLANHTIDAGAVLKGLVFPGSISDRIRASYENLLFHGATLQDLPDAPRFVINATNVQSGALFRFSKPYIWDWRVGQVRNPKVPLSVAVAASSAFPPVLSPAELDFKKLGCVFEPGSGKDLQIEPFISKAVLTDGGVYDNLGLETTWKQFRTILVSDGGGHFEPGGSPHRDWLRHVIRILGIIDNQVRSLRKRQVIDAFKSGSRLGAYWGIRTDILDYRLADALPCPLGKTLKLAGVATRLKQIDTLQQERLINWGFAVCDAGMRRHVDPALPAPAGFPYPSSGVG
jgi:NTE family protein